MEKRQGGEERSKTGSRYLREDSVTREPVLSMTPESPRETQTNVKQKTFRCSLETQNIAREREISFIDLGYLRSAEQRLRSDAENDPN